ncbi:unnamed protein product [Dibothriocephalus latus]|uniref:Thioredoxin domain-containing protein n=1 Tax=Dibothriocephalus latus TaxID=60516 RepID=A0A3P6SAI0_DIBLA|nr:unnamed protein product [Dibothriocephalus latus]
MSLEECLGDAKSRLVMVAFVKFRDSEDAELMKILEGINKENKRLVILAVDATKNIKLAQEFNVTACPTFLFFRNRVLLGSRVTSKEEKLRKDIEKYSKVFVSMQEQHMRLDECLISAKARLVMTAFVDLKDEENTEIMHLLEDISRENKPNYLHLQIDMSFEECLSTAKARLVMVAFVNFRDPSNEDVMKLMQEISKANKRIVVMAVDASKNMALARQFNVTMYPTFIFFRNRVVVSDIILTFFTENCILLKIVAQTDGATHNLGNIVHSPVLPLTVLNLYNL